MIAVLDVILKLCEIFVIADVILNLLAGYKFAGSDRPAFIATRSFFNKTVGLALTPLRAILPKLPTDPAGPLLVAIILTLRYALAFNFPAA